MSDEYNEPLKCIFEFFENHYIHEGRVVDQSFDNLVYVRSMFSHIEFDCLIEINERFILEFYSQYHINYNLQGQMFVEFVIQNQLFSFSLEEFGQILGIPYKSDCYFSDKWSLDDLPFSVPVGGPYQTNTPSPNDIKLLFQIERHGVVTRIRHEQEIVVEDSQILTREITDVMKTWVDITRENVFCLGGNRDHVLACLCHMFFCIATSTKYNLAYFIAKRIEFVTKQARLILPYGMLLTLMFDHIMSENPDLSSHLYVLYDRVMYPLAAQQERKTQKDYGTRKGRSSTSSSFAFGQPSSSHPNDDDNDGNDEVQLRDEQRGGIMSIGKGIKNLLKGKQKNEEDDTATPSPITKSSSPSPPNAPSKTPSTKDTSSTFGTTSSSFEPKLQSLPPTSNNTHSPQPFNPFLENIMDAPPRPSNPILL
ncbi:hypothetical protein Tco_1227733 [Tanacetum coccineum]